jgi:hypothetical protein
MNESLDFDGHASGSRLVKQAPQREFHSEIFTDLRDQLRAHERVPAKRKKIVLAPDSRHPKKA